MRIFKSLMTSALLASAATAGAQALTPSLAPNACQRDMQQRAYGMFIHFGMNTFIDQEWSEGIVPPTTYNPTQLDCDQWVRVARDAGFRYVLLVTKHHDGFCLWDSAVTDYDVASSGNPTDVVKAVSDACRKYGLKFGVYYSLWDRHEPSYKSENFKDYLDFMDAQLTELLTNYGDVCELWFDGGWDKPDADWNIPHVYELVKSLQPECAVGINVSAMMAEDKPDGVSYGSADPDDMVHPENVTFRYFPTDFRLKDPYIANANDGKIYTMGGKKYYLPFEHTICLSKAWNWFQKQRQMETRDIDELEELFYRSLANDNTLVVNVPPDSRGLIRQNEINALMELRDRVGITSDYRKSDFKKLPRPISVGCESRATSEWDAGYTSANAFDGGLYRRWASRDTVAQLEVTLPEGENTFDRIAIFEYMDEAVAPDGFSRKRANRITSYSIDAFNNGEWQAIYVSTEPMGDCKVINFAVPQHAEKVRLDIKHSTNPPSIHEFSIYNTKR